MPDTKAHTVYKLADGTRVPSVTTIIGDSLGWNKNALLAWTRKMALAGDDPDKVRDAAADVGTLAHAMIHDYLTQEKTVDLAQWTPEQVQRASQAYGAYIDWERSASVTHVASELPVVSEEYHFGGTIDAIMWLGTTLTVVDFKTSNGVFVEHRVQVSAYQHLYEANLEPKGIKTSAVILQLGKDDASFTPHLYQDLSKEWEAFLCCLRLYELHKVLK